jgi:hypothetical protein
VRFAIPAVTLGTDLLFEKFLAADYAASQQAIELASGQIEKREAPVPLADGNVIERLKKWFTENSLDVGARLEALKQTAEKITERVINLIVIFLLQTLVIPVLLLWALYAAAKATFERPPRSNQTL